MQKRLLKTSWEKANVSVFIFFKNKDCNSSNINPSSQNAFRYEQVYEWHCDKRSSITLLSKKATQKI